MTGQPSLTHGIVSLCLQAPRQHKPGAHRQQASCGCSCEHAQHRAAAAEHPVAGATGPLQRPLGELLIISRISWLAPLHQRAGCSCSCQCAQHGAAAAEELVAGAAAPLQHPTWRAPGA